MDPIDELVDTVCQRSGVTREQLLGKRGQRRVSWARHDLWWHIRHHPSLNLTFQDIARLFERDRSTVVRGVRAYRQWRRAQRLNARTTNIVRCERTRS